MTNSEIEALSWKEWVSAFKHGETWAAYIFMVGITLNIIAFIILPNKSLAVYLALIAIAGLVGNLVDITAHLWIRGYVQGLSVDSSKKFFEDMIKGRTHVFYALLVAELVDILGIGVGNGLATFIFGFAVIDVGVGIYIVLVSRYYH
ncbi:MAG: hypothetical protein QXL94_04275 [Candidatus Parvarchaeum sp.]